MNSKQAKFKLLINKLQKQIIITHHADKYFVPLFIVSFITDIK